ncbi:glycoside hydrolase family 28 protein, partial [Laetiporus sulphureus 93-53]
SQPASVTSQYSSDLSISDVHYIDVTGLSSDAEGTVVVDIDCSQEREDITATGTNLTSQSPDGTAIYICTNVATVDELDFNCFAT